jgi:energy-coupling factor transporter ATP-binding protein EcfA2
MFQKATKQSAKLRVALFGPSGSGKTFTSLSMATGIVKREGGEIAVIDSERRSASKYADRFKFDVCDLNTRTIAGYREAMKAAEKYRVLIIDSLSHAWDELLSEVDRLAASKYSGNSMRAWGEGTPKQRQFIEALLGLPGHIFGTMRVDTDWAMETDSRGKVKPVKVGLKPRQGKGIEYEFDLLMEISPDHVAHISKDRTGKYQDATIEKPGEKFGHDLSEWLSDGVTPAAERKDDRPKRKELDALIAKHNVNDQTIMGWYDHFGVRTLTELNDDQLNKLTAKVAAKYAATTAA